MGFSMAKQILKYMYNDNNIMIMITDYLFTYLHTSSLVYTVEREN